MTTKPDEVNQAASPIDGRSKIGPDPHRPGRERWRSTEENLTVWAIIQDILMVGGVDDATQASPQVVADTANGFRISPDAVSAARAYSADRRHWTDTLILSNGFDDVDD